MKNAFFCVQIYIIFVCNYLCMHVCMHHCMHLYFFERIILWGRCDATRRRTTKEANDILLCPILISIDILLRHLVSTSSMSSSRVAQQSNFNFFPSCRATFTVSEDARCIFCQHLQCLTRRGVPRFRGRCAAFAVCVAGTALRLNDVFFLLS